MTITLIDPDKKFRGGADITPDGDSGKELGELIYDLQVAVNLVENGIVDGDFAGTALGRMVRTGAGAYAVIQDALAKAVAPAVGDDAADGYGVGSLWIDTALGNVYVCVDDTTGAAVWRLALNEATAGGELAGTYPNPTVADNVLDAANALTGAVAGLVVDKGTPSSCIIAFDDGAGTADRPDEADSYAFSIGGALVATLEARDVVVDENDFLRSNAGGEEADTITMAAALAACINAHSVLGLRVRASVMGAAGDAQWYVQCYTELQADITAGLALTCVLAGGAPGQVMNRATAVTASKRQLFPIRYEVTAQDVFCDQINFDFGCSAIVAYQLDVLTAANDYTRMAWNGAVTNVTGQLTVDNSGATDWAAGNVICGWILGNVA